MLLMSSGRSIIWPNMASPRPMLCNGRSDTTIPRRAHPAREGANNGALLSGRRSCENGRRRQGMLGISSDDCRHLRGLCLQRRRSIRLIYGDARRRTKAVSHDDPGDMRMLAAPLHEIHAHRFEVGALRILE